MHNESTTWEVLWTQTNREWGREVGPAWHNNWGFSNIQEWKTRATNIIMQLLRSAWIHVLHLKWSRVYIPLDLWSSEWGVCNCTILISTETLLTNYCLFVCFLPLVENMVTVLRLLNGPRLLWPQITTMIWNRRQCPIIKREATELVELDIGWIVFCVPQST